MYIVDVIIVMNNRKNEQSVRQLVRHIFVLSSKSFSSESEKYIFKITIFVIILTHAFTHIKSNSLKRYQVSCVLTFDDII